MLKVKNKFPRSIFDMQQSSKIGVLLMNLGTPDAPETNAVRKYLGQFLHDWRVVEISRWLWCPLLHGIILRRYPSKVAKIYRSVWWKEGSPLLVISNRQAQKLEQSFSTYQGQEIVFEVAMRYGNPSVRHALGKLRQKNAQKILVLPMYPQYSTATSASSFDEVFNELKKWRWMPELRLIREYYHYPEYIECLANTIKEAWENHAKPEKLVISFHGTPELFRDLGDPYYYQCQATANSLAKYLKLEPKQWELTFQSQFGNAPWLKPAIDMTLEKLAKQSVKSVDVICPGFSADCIETLEEIEKENFEVFKSNGGEIFHYIEALNARDDHIKALHKIVTYHIQGW